MPSLGFQAIEKGHLSIMKTCLDYIEIKEPLSLEQIKVCKHPIRLNPEKPHELERLTAYSESKSERSTTQ